MAKKTEFFVRDPRWVAVKSRNSCYFLRGEDRLELETKFGSALTLLLDGVTAPISQKEFDALVRGLSPEVPKEEVQEWLSALRENEVLISGTEQSLLERLQGFVEFAPSEKVCQRLVFCITGSVQSSEIGRVVFDLMNRFAASTDVVITAAAENFYNPEILRRSGARIWRKTTDQQGSIQMPHIELAHAADLVVIFPASAAAISRIAQGSCTDLTSMIAITTRAPVVVVPGLNVAMWTSPAVQRNIALLEKDGFYIVHPGPGVALTDQDDPKVSMGRAGLRLDDPSDLPYLLMHIMAIHDETRK